MTALTWCLLALAQGGITDCGVVYGQTSPHAGVYL